VVFLRYLDMEKVVRFGSVVIVRTVKTGQYDTGCTYRYVIGIAIHKVMC